MQAALSLRLPKPLSKALEALASATERPKSYLVRKALEAYLAEHSDYRLAMQRLQDRDDPVLSGADLRKRLGL